MQSASSSGKRRKLTPSLFDKYGDEIPRHHFKERLARVKELMAEVLEDMPDDKS